MDHAASLEGFRMRRPSEKTEGRVSSRDRMISLGAGTMLNQNELDSRSVVPKLWIGTLWWVLTRFLVGVGKIR